MSQRDDLVHAHEKLVAAIQSESLKFQEFYLWLEKEMPEAFFEQVSSDDLMIIAHNLMSFDLQGYFSSMVISRRAFVMVPESPNADLQILEHYQMYGIKNYRAFVSATPPPVKGIKTPIRVAVIHFTVFVETHEELYPIERKEELKSLVMQRNPAFSEEEFEKLLGELNTQFLNALEPERLSLALDMFFRAKTRDHCQYEVRYNENWKEKKSPSMQIMLAWRNTPKHNFLYRIARMVHRHGLVMAKLNAAYIAAYGPQPILIMGLGLHGIDGKAAWEVADIPDFLRELVTLKYFGEFDILDETFVSSGLMRGNLCQLLRSMAYFVHQNLVHLDANLYTVENIREALCRHPELTLMICNSFEYKFHPDKNDLGKYQQTKEGVLKLVEKLDTGREVNDNRRKNVLSQAMNMVDYTLKTNFYRNNKLALAFRLDPEYMNHLPYNRKQKFPELPYAVFYVKGMHFFGYHIRFKDLSRGGLRTVFIDKVEQMTAELNNVFSECYNLAYTQQKKNKDIPEGGAKGVIFLKPYTRLESEMQIYRQELRAAHVDEEEIQKKLQKFHDEQRMEFLYQSQRAYVSSILTLVNCEPDGRLKAKHIIDYWRRPEYLYLGPDENMHNAMIEWIADFSVRYDYHPKSAFISSKPKVGINHKQYGVTSLGVNVYMHEVLKYMKIDPETQEFSIKISGGPDGDVAGNQIENLYKYYPKTAKLKALTDVSGTIYDPEGLDLSILHQLFLDEKPIRFYPPDMLHNGGFLLDLKTKQTETAYNQRTLCWHKDNNKVYEDWLSGSDMNHLYSHNIHEVVTDIFIPGGGRPRTINQNNFRDYLTSEGKPSSKAIVEGANLYLTPSARRSLEKLGVIIIKDSSANKCGVICSSFEVLAGLTLGDEGFLQNKEVIVKQILERLRVYAWNEANLMLRTHRETSDYLTNISEKISERINYFTYRLLDYLDPLLLPNDKKHPLMKCFFAYCLPILRENYQDLLIKNIADHHKKAAISSFLASQLVYKRGLDWSPSIVDILPVVWEDPEIVEPI